MDHQRPAHDAKNKDLIFIHTNPHSHRHTRTKLLDTQVRRHLMRDIGRGRRKSHKSPPGGTFVWDSAETQKLSPDTVDRKDSLSTELDQQDAKVPKIRQKSLPQPTQAYIPASPLVYTMAVFEKEWGEDSFSAYGLTLFVIAGRKATMPTYSVSTFWAPFAFAKSPFLHHYQQIFNTPSALIPLYCESASYLQSLALKRCLQTIQCIETRIASPDVRVATSDSVLQAVIALVCYNLATDESDQAMVHLNGLAKVIAARGEVLRIQPELLIMISWVDITIALLYDAIPLFPLSDAAGMSPVNYTHCAQGLPGPLSGIINSEDLLTLRLQSVLYSMAELNKVASYLQSHLTLNPNAAFVEEKHFAKLLNPLSHQLLQYAQPMHTLMDTELLSESLRLGALLWIVQLKRICCCHPGTTKVYTLKLLDILRLTSRTKHSRHSPDRRVVRFWLLVLCGISDPSAGELASTIAMITEDMEENTCEEWGGLMLGVRRMPWISVFEHSCALLKDIVLKSSFAMLD